MFIDETNPFENSLITYLGNHNLSFIEQDYDEFIIDVHDYSTNVINELQHRFPNQQLFTSMKILNPRKWPNDSQELLLFGDNDLEILLKYFEQPNFHNNIQFSTLFNIKKCKKEWAGFKIITINNFFSNNIEILLPLLIQDYNNIQWLTKEMQLIIF